MTTTFSPLSVRLPESLRKALDAECDRRETTISAFTLAALEAALADGTPVSTPVGPGPVGRAVPGFFDVRDADAVDVETAMALARVADSNGGASSVAACRELRSLLAEFDGSDDEAEAFRRSLTAL